MLYIKALAPINTITLPTCVTLSRRKICPKNATPAPASIITSCHNSIVYILYPFLLCFTFSREKLFHVKNKSINGAFFTPKRHRSTLMLVYASTFLSLLYQASYIASIITTGAVASNLLLCYMLAVYACHSLYFLSC